MKTMLTVNFDTKRIVYTKNPLDRKAGEIVVLKDGERAIVYAVFDVNDWQDMQVRKAFQSVKSTFENFLNDLNLRAERMTAAARDIRYSSIAEYETEKLTEMGSKLARKYNLNSMFI